MCTTVGKDRGATSCKCVIPNELSEEDNSQIISHLHQQTEDRVERELQDTRKLEVNGFTLEEY